MIIFEDGSCQITKGHPNDNFLKGLNCEQPKWVVPDETELAEKIQMAFRWTPVENENGELIDIIPIMTTHDEPESVI